MKNEEYTTSLNDTTSFKQTLADYYPMGTNILNTEVFQCENMGITHTITQSYIQTFKNIANISLQVR